MNISIDESHIADFSNLLYPALTYGQVIELIEVKNRTLRTWLNRYFPGVGTRKKDGKLLFTGLECLGLQVFAHLVTRLTIKAETAMIVANAGYIHLGKLLKSGDDPIFADIFLIIRNANREAFEFEFVSGSEAWNLFYKIDPAPFIVVPFNLKSMAAYDCLRKIG